MWSNVSRAPSSESPTYTSKTNRKRKQRDLSTTSEEMPRATGSKLCRLRQASHMYAEPRIAAPDIQPVKAESLPSLSSAPNATSITEAQRQFFLRELEVVKSWNCAEPFLEPVDPVELRLPDYFEIIKKPMDLGTMRTKLESQCYSSTDAFLADLDLIVENTLEYNGLGHPVTHMGFELNRQFQDEILDLVG